MKRNQNRWFFVSGTSVRMGVLSAAWVDVVDSKELRCPVIVSLPKTCGLAVTRNRFRRMSRSCFTVLSLRDNWSESCNEESKNSSEPNIPDIRDGRLISTRKVIWIRVDRRHRLQKRIVLADWKLQFDKLYARLLQANPTPKHSA